MSKSLEPKKIYLSFFLLLSAFGPIIVQKLNLRFDQFFIYSSFIFLIIKFPKSTFTLNKNVLLFTSPFFLVAIYSLAISSLNIDQRSIKSILSGFENFIQPAVLFLLLNFFYFQLNKSEIIKNLHLIFETLVLLLCLHSLFMILSVYYDYSNFYNLFKPSQSFVKNTTHLVRHSGVFDQPVESGLIYSMALILWLYLFTLKHKIKIKTSVSIFEMTKLFLIVSGGLISISKTFLFVGSPLFFIICLFFYKPKEEILQFAAIFSFSIFFLLSLASWPGSSMFLGYFTPKNYSLDTTISILSGSRYNLIMSSDNVTTLQSSVLDNFINIYQKHFFGEGITKYMAFDNGLLEFFSYAGLLGILSFFYLLFLIFYTTWRLHLVDKKMAIYILAISVLIVIANLGSPVFTLNRVSIPIWIIFFTISTYLDKLDLESK